MQQLKTQISPAAEAMGNLIGAHASLTRALNEELVSEHGLSISEYECLLLLSRAEERSMRRVDLAREVKLSPSGITRMVDRLGASGLVENGSCETDARTKYAVLTDAGMEKVQDAWPGHVAEVERILGERLDDGEIASLVELLGRLTEPVECDPGGSNSG